MAPIMEIAYMPLKAEFVPQVGFNDVQGQQWRDLLLRNLEQQEGIRMDNVYLAKRVEDPASIVLFAAWDGIESHEKFIASEGYGPFVQKVVAKTAADLQLYHVHLDPWLTVAPFKAPIVEFVTVYFPSGYPGDLRQKHHDAWTKFCSTADGFDGYHGAVGGWVAEELVDPKSGEKGSAYVQLLGWASVQAHMDFRQTQAFKDNIPAVRQAPDLKNLVVFHAAPTQ